VLQKCYKGQFIINQMAMTFTIYFGSFPRFHQSCSQQ